MKASRFLMVLLLGSVIMLVGSEGPAEAEAAASTSYCAQCGAQDCELVAKDGYLECSWNGGDCQQSGECSFTLLDDSALLPDGTYLVGWQPTEDELEGQDRRFLRDCEERIVGRGYSDVAAAEMRTETAVIVL